MTNRSKANVIGQKKAVLSEEDLQKIVKRWFSIAHVQNIKFPKNAERLFLYLLTEMDQEGVLLQTQNTISQSLNLNKNEVRNILTRLERLKIIYRKYGIIGLCNLSNQQ